MIGLAGGKQDPDFHTKPQIALELIERAQAAGIAFKAIVVGCLFGDNNTFEGTLQQRHLPYMLAHRGTIGRGWVPANAADSFEEAAQELPLSAWQRIERRFRDGHMEYWWATESALPGYGCGTGVRAICGTTDRRALPDLSTWYLSTKGAQRAPLAEVVRLYGLRNGLNKATSR